MLELRPGQVRKLHIIVNSPKFLNIFYVTSSESFIELKKWIRLLEFLVKFWENPRVLDFLLNWTENKVVFFSF